MPTIREEERYLPPTIEEGVIERIGDRTILPYGEMARFARELDCSRERVRQICNKLGVRAAERGTRDRTHREQRVSETG